MTTEFTYYEIVKDGEVSYCKQLIWLTLPDNVVHELSEQEYLQAIKYQDIMD